MAVRRFSPSLANAALPLVSRIVSDVVGHATRLAVLATAYEAKKGEPDRSQAELNDASREMKAVAAQRDACVAELVDLGVEAALAASGEIDFPGEIDGSRVLFCWKLGEERVEHFHAEDEGVESRRPIPVPCNV